MKVILGVAAVAKSEPAEPSKKVTDDAMLMPKLQLAFLVEDVEYQPSFRSFSRKLRDQIAVESESRVSALNIANILKAAGAEATPINRQGGYGRKRRSPIDSSSNDFDSLEISENLQSVSPRGGSDKRRKRSPQKEPAHSNAHQYGLVDNPDVVVKPHGKYGDLQKILALSGAKPQPISRGVSYGRRKKR